MTATSWNVVTREDMAKIGELEFSLLAIKIQFEVHCINNNVSTRSSAEGVRTPLSKVFAGGKARISIIGIHRQDRYFGSWKYENSMSEAAGQKVDEVYWVGGCFFLTIKARREFARRALFGPGSSLLQ